jgi:SAM-dependent methyltransferase
VTEPWTLDELAHAGAEHLDPAFIADYDRKQGPDPVDDLSVLRRHGLDETATLVDLGAGTGRLTLAAAPHCRRVIAVEVSPAMLDVLQRNLARARLTNVECIEAGFLTYEHEGPPADAVYMRNALHHLPDFWKAVALDRVAQVLRPGGVSFASAISSSTSAPPRPTPRSGGGSTARSLIRRRATPVTISPSTCGPSTARSAGCSSHADRGRVRDRRRRVRSFHLREIHVPQAVIRGSCSPRTGSPGR